MSKITLRSLVNTTLKRLPYHEDRLTSNQKAILPEGEVLTIRSNRLIGNDLSFECDDPLYLGKWYVHCSHVEIILK
jgi:hypothetical protein